MAKTSSESKSESQANTTNTTNLEDRRVAADGSFVATEGSSIQSTDNTMMVGGESIVATGGSTINATVERLDAALAQKAIEEAGKAASGAIGGMTTVSSKSMDVIDAANERSSDLALAVAKGAKDSMSEFLNFQSDANADLLRFTDNSIAKMSDAFATAAAGESGQLTNTVGKLGMAALLAAAAVGVTWAMKKS